MTLLRKLANFKRNNVSNVDVKSAGALNQASPDLGRNRPLSSKGAQRPEVATSRTATSKPSTGQSSSEAKKSWRNSVIAARKALPQDALDAVYRQPSCGSVSGRASTTGHRQSLRQVAAKQVHRKNDAYDDRRATMVNPVSLSASVGMSSAVQSENYYQQSVAGLRQQEQARRLKEAMSRGSTDPISDAAVKHAFFQNHILHKRKEQEADRRRETIDAMIHASLPANVTGSYAPVEDRRRSPTKGSRMPHQPLIVPGANYVPDEY